MSKENGRATRPGTGVEFKMGGVIHLELTPEDIGEIAAGKSTDLEIEGLELRIHLEPAKENRIAEITPWFEMDDALLTINNSIRQDNKTPGCGQMTDYLSVVLAESEKRSICFTVNPKQARALFLMLMQYTQAWDAFEALRCEPARA